MSTPFAIIATAWSFYKKQPVLNEIAFWLFFLPIGTIDVSISLIETVSAQSVNIPTGVSMTATDYMLMIPVFIALIYLIFWGQACAFTVCKRMLASNAGRTRTSFKATRDQAKKYIWPLFLTEVLRGIITLLLGLLLIVPGVIYSIRTLFYDIMMIEKGKVAYGRDALKPSIDLVKGRTWDVFLRMLVIGLCIFVPLGMLQLLITASLTAIDERLITLAIVLSDFVESFAAVFFIVCSIALYADLKKSHGTT